MTIQHILICDFESVMNKQYLCYKCKTRIAAAPSSLWRSVELLDRLLECSEEGITSVCALSVLTWQ